MFFFKLLLNKIFFRLLDLFIFDESLFKIISNTKNKLLNYFLIFKINKDRSILKEKYDLLLIIEKINPKKIIISHKLDFQILQTKIDEIKLDNNLKNIMNIDLILI